MCMHFPHSECLWQLKIKSILGISPKNVSVEIQLYFHFCLNWKMRYLVIQVLEAFYVIFVSSNDTFDRRDFLKKYVHLTFVWNIFIQEYSTRFQCCGSGKQNNPLLKIWSFEYCLKMKKCFNSCYRIKKGQPKIPGSKRFW